MSDFNAGKRHESAFEIEQSDDLPATESPFAKQQAFTGCGAAPQVAKSPEEKRLLLKLDLSVVPCCGLIYFVAYLDRNAIGNARLMGLEKDLGLTPNQFYNCLTMFFVGYIIFMLPGNIGLRIPHVRAPLMIGGCVVAFGAFCAGIGGSQNYATVLTLRIFVGSAQAFIQGLGLYLSFWYKRDELASRSGVLYSAATISGAFSGLIAYGVQRDLTKDATGLEPWRWLFIIDGCSAVFVGIMTMLVIPRFADRIRGGKNWLLSPTDIRVALERAQAYNTLGAKTDFRGILIALKDPKSWLFACINAGVALGISSVGNFLPTFVRSFGYSAERAQLFSVIPYACAGVSTVVIAFLSDRFNTKGPFLLFTLGVANIGYIILLTVRSVPVLVFATTLITAGLYPSVILLTSWLGINTAGFTKRGTAWAMAEIFGQVFSIMGTHVYDGPPRFTKGHSIVLGFLLFGIVCVSALIAGMGHLNQQKAAELQQAGSQGEHHPHMQRSLEQESDYHVGFRYIL